MVTPRWPAALLTTALVMVSVSALAQPPAPHVGYVFPAGGRQGSTFRVALGGQFLDGVNVAYVSGGGVEAKVVEHTKPLTPKQLTQLRERIEELRKKKPDATILKEIAEIREKLATFVRRPPNPAIAETVTLEIQLAPDAEPGDRELRLGTPASLTNPLVFSVDRLAEFSRKADRKAIPPAATPKAAQAKAAPPAVTMDVTMPSIVNGQILPGAADRYRFTAKKGQKLVAVARSRSLVPFIADAVPGWFQAALTLYDDKGKEVAYADDFHYQLDPVLAYEVPRDGPYVLEIRDTLYRGREDFVYRIALGELPFVTSSFPLGGKAGEKTTIQLTGYNLSATTITRQDAAEVPGIHLFPVLEGKRSCCRIPFAVDTLPECLEQEPNGQPSEAQKVSCPIIVNGRIDQPGDQDVFQIEGRANDVIVAEVLARRLGSPLDSGLRLTDAAGKELASNDDHEDKGAGLITHHADSYLRATLPAAGIYFLHLDDVQHKGGADYAYRLRISPPRPDFELRVVPSSITIRGGVSVPLTVHAIRKDGFDGAIAVTLKDPPPGLTLAGAQVPAGQDEVRITLAEGSGPSDEPISVALEGHAKIGGKDLVRPVVPADDMMQAFAYRHLVPAQDLKLVTTGRRVGKLGVQIASELPVKIPAGGSVRVRVGMPLNPPALNVKMQLELSEPPDGITIDSVSEAGRATEMVFKSDAAKSRVGQAGNLIVNVFAQRPQAAEKTKAAANRRTPVGTLPAIPFVVIAK